MVLGQKIKELRLAKKMTQSALADGIVTRNMLSQIENGVALPSVPTMTAIAKKLDVPMAYFFSETGDLGAFRKLAYMDKIKKCLETGNYESCISKLRELNVFDDETEFIAAKALLCLGIRKYRAGYLESAKEHLTQAIAHAQHSLYTDEAFPVIAETYLSAICYIREHDSAALAAEATTHEEMQIRADIAYIRALATGTDTFEYEMACPLYAEHLRAHKAVLEGQADTAARALGALLDTLNVPEQKERYDLVRYYALCDLEVCSQKSEDYKTAYACAIEKQALEARMTK